MNVPSSRFRQVMLNLLLNAIKAAGEGGQVHAILRCTPERVVFTVANTGLAMSDEDMQRQLETEDSDDPQGFGLWICRELGIRYGGAFCVTPSVDIAPPYRTSLCFWLPNPPRYEQENPAVD